MLFWKKIYAFSFLLFMFFICIISFRRMCARLDDFSNANKIENKLIQIFPFSKYAKEIYGMTNLFISHNEIVEDGKVFIRNSDGMIQSLSHVEFDTHGAAEGINELKEFCNNKNVKFAYISFPSKCEPIDYNKKYGIDSNYSKQRVDYLNSLEEFGVNVLDIGALMKSDGFTRENIFYKTDHHWNSKSALYAAKSIAEYIKSELNIENVTPNLLEPDLFSYAYYPQSWFGETGRNLSLTWGGVLDDFVLIKPEYETLFHYKVPGQYDIEGDFSILVNEKVLSKKINFYNTSLYYIYLPKYGSPTILKNKKYYGAKILIIRDSFSNSVAPFLLLSCGGIDLWDMRGNQKSVFEYIENNNFDVVLVAYTDYWNKEMYHFK